MNEKNDYQKSILYPDPAFPFVIFTITPNSCIPQGPGYQDLHWHEDLQFTLVTKGTVSIMVNGIHYTLKAHEGIFINSSLLHMTTHISKDGEYISFNFPTKMLSVLYGSKLETDYVLHFTNNYSLPAIHLTRDCSWQCQILDMLLELRSFYLSAESFAKEYELALKIKSIWLIFIRHARKCIQSSSRSLLRKQECMIQMLSYIHNHFKTQISLTDIADAAHISQAECCRLFKKILNTSPYDYLIRYRINKAIDLLRQTNCSVTEISFSVGFNDCSHFIQLFKRYTGKTPHQYRL